MMLCDKLREMRELKELPQRKVAAALDIDTATYCKIEKGIMRPKREHLLILADLFEVEEADLLKQWLAEKITSVIQNDEKFATEALSIANKILESNEKSSTP